MAEEEKMKKIERKTWVCITAKGKVRDCSTERNNLDLLHAGDTIVRGVVTVELKEANPKKK